MKQRVELLKEAGADEVVVLEPTTDLLGLTAEQFVEHLCDQYKPAGIVEGGNFRFGRGRQGDIDMLKSLGEQMDFDVVVAEPFVATLNDLLTALVSSTFVRWLLSHGRVADVERCLGRTYDVAGRVVEGEKRGRTIGIPTVNLDIEYACGESNNGLQCLLVPADGVYVGSAVLEDGGRWPAAISVGAKPTVQHGRRVVEAHLIGFGGDLYGRAVTLQFRRWLRDQRAFADVESLKRQITRDLDEAKRLMTLDLVDCASKSVTA
jgi:riboflavin kinase/FMN adenylyltransferase